MAKENIIKILEDNKEEVARYERNKNRIKEIEKIIKKIEKSNIIKITPGYTLTSGNTNSISKKVENSVEIKEKKIEEYEEEKKELEEENEKLLENVKKVNILLKCLKFKEKIVVKEHFIEGNSYKDIGERIFGDIFKETRSEDVIKDIAKKALNKMERVLRK